MKSRFQDWQEFIAAWVETRADYPCSAGDLLRLAHSRGLLSVDLGSGNRQSQSIKLAYSIKSYGIGKNWGGWEIATDKDTHTHQLVFCLVPVPRDLCDTCKQLIRTSPEKSR